MTRLGHIYKEILEYVIFVYFMHILKSRNRLYVFYVHEGVDAKRMILRFSFIDVFYVFAK